jgi:hypothetical protein
MDDPGRNNLWFEAIGGLTLIVAVAGIFLVAVLKAEKHRYLDSNDQLPFSTTPAG